MLFLKTGNISITTKKYDTAKSSVVLWNLEGKSIWREWVKRKTGTPPFI